MYSPGKSVMLAACGTLLAGSVHAQDMVCHDQWPAWGPDGASIVFASTVTGDHEIYTLSLTNGALQRVTDTPGRDAHPSLSPDGRSIAFQSPRGDDGTHLYVVNRNGGEPRRVTHLPGFAGIPVWSPDGTRIAFQYRSTAPGAKWALRVVSLADGRVTALTEGTANDQVVNWAPDGNRLVFHSDRTGMNQVYLWEENQVRQLTREPFEHRNAAWAPDGETIALRSTRDGEHGIYLMDPNRFELQRIGTVSVEHGAPLFSPDGSTVLITPSGPEGTRIATLDVRTGVVAPVRAACGRD